jgi:uncharacterized protein
VFVPPAAVAAPGLWVARNGNSTVYLFGTVHILRPDLNWESPEIANAFAQSSELWLELPNVDDHEEAQTLLKQYGFDPDHPLAGKLSPKDRARLDAAAKTAQMPRGEAMLEPMSPWLAGMMLDNELLIHSGYNADNGVEHVLSQQAAKEQKLVFGFETFDQQIRIFADLSPALQIEVLENSLDDFASGPQKQEEMVEAWMKDDQAALTRLIIDDIKTPLPALYQVLVVARNDDWVATIEEWLKKPGVRFVAVGAGHLTGPDSVQTKLEQHGIHVAAVTGPAQPPQTLH